MIKKYDLYITKEKCIGGIIKKGAWALLWSRTVRNASLNCHLVHDVIYHWVGEVVFFWEHHHPVENYITTWYVDNQQQQHYNKVDNFFY